MVPYTPLQRLFVYYWISEPVYVSKTTTYGSKYSLASETEFTYDTNRMLPTKSVTTDAAGNTYETRIKYAKDYGNITGSTITDRYGMLAAIKQMLDHHAYNLPIETVKYRNGKIVSANLVLYKTLSDNPQRPGVVPATEMAVYTDAPIGHTAFTHSSIYNAPYTSEFSTTPDTNPPSGTTSTTAPPCSPPTPSTARYSQSCTATTGHCRSPS